MDEHGEEVVTISPVAADRSAEDRAQGAMAGTHPRLNRENGSAGMILVPDDCLEGLGNFSVLDADGNPIGLRFGKRPPVVGRSAYFGELPDETYRYNAAAYRADRASVVIDSPLVQTRRPPTPDTPGLPELPRPLPVVVVVVEADVAGYGASSPTSPHWVAFSFGRGGKHSVLRYFTRFEGGEGAAFRVILPANVSRDVEEIGVWMPAPKTSRPAAPGPMFLQRVVTLREWNLPYYDLTGPFRFPPTGRPAPTANETVLSDPAAPAIRLLQENKPCRPGLWYAGIVWTDKNGQTMRGATAQQNVLSSNKFTIREDGEIRLLSGKGLMEITRPPAPPGAKGWRLPVYVGGSGDDWAFVFDRLEGYGTESRPFPLSLESIKTKGWRGDEEPYGLHSRFILSGAGSGLPDENTTGIEGPENAPEVPEVIQGARPPAGVYHYQQTEEVEGGAEGLPSEATRAEVGDNQVAQVFLISEANRVPNAQYTDVGSDGLPIAHEVVTTNGYGRVEAEGLLLGTTGAQPGATPTPEDATVEMDADPSTASAVRATFTVEDPTIGAPAGSIVVVLWEKSRTGVITERILHTVTEPGDYDFRFIIEAIGGSGFTYTADTKKVKLVVRGAGVSKNFRFRCKRLEFKWYKWWRRKAKKLFPLPGGGGGPPVDPPPPPPDPEPPTDDTGIEPPPEPADSPEATPMPKPDRPEMAGTVEETLGFEAGIPAGWTARQEGSAVVSVSAAAALVGAQGARVLKAAAGQLSAGWIDKTFEPPPGHGFKHAGGVAIKNRLPVWPSDGSIRMHGLARPSDGDLFAWVEPGTTREVSELTIDEDPVLAGNVQVSLGGAVTNVAVLSTPEVATLTVSGTPNAPGEVTLRFGEAVYRVPLGGDPVRFSLRIKESPSTRGYVSLAPEGGTGRQVEARAIHTPTQVAALIKALGWPGWNVTQIADALYFEANLAGPRSAPVFDPGTTRTRYELLVLQPGVAEPKEDLVARIKGTKFAGYAVTAGGLANQAVFTAEVGGPKTDPTYDPGPTGAAGAFVVGTQGSIDTPSALAARIRALTYAGYAVSGSDTLIRWTAAAPGTRQNLAYDSGTTGAVGTYRTVVQGSNLDVMAVVEDSRGVRRQSKILAGLSTATVWNVARDVSGAGTKTAVVSFWGSVGAAPLELLARFEDVDLSDHPDGLPRLGVVGESSAALTWELYFDDARISDRGLVWFRDHDERGNRINQMWIDSRPGSPVSQNLLIQEGRVAAIPGERYSPGIYARWDGVPVGTPARLLALAAHGTEGQVEELGEIAVAGSGEWEELKLEGEDEALTVPVWATEIRFASRDIGEGQIVVQEAVISPGLAVKRTNGYALSGTYRTTHDLRTPDPSPLPDEFERVRRAWEADTLTPAGTAISAAYRSAPVVVDADGEEVIGAWSDYEADPLDVPDLPIVQSFFEFSGDGSVTPELLAHSPRVEYVLMRTPARTLATMTRSDRSEFSSGITFEELEEWEPFEATMILPLPSGGFFRQPLPFGVIGIIAPCKAHVYSRADRDEILKRSGRETYVIEDEGETVEVLFGGRPTIKRVAGTETGGKKALYVAEFPGGYVVEVGVLG